MVPGSGLGRRRIRGVAASFAAGVGRTARTAAANVPRGLDMLQDVLPAIIHIVLGLDFYPNTVDRLVVPLFLVLVFEGFALLARLAPGAMPPALQQLIPLVLGEQYAPPS